MSEKILFENNLDYISEASEPQAEPDGSSAAYPDSGTYSTVTNTNTDDIGRTERKLGFANSIASRSLPATLGFMQPISSPSGYVFGFRKKSGSDDMEITRTFVDTGVREVVIDITNEVYQEMIALFGKEFYEFYKSYLYYDGKDVDFDLPFEQISDGKMASFLISYATWKMTKETNIDFITWIATVATNMGSFEITSPSEIGDIKSAIGEMKANLYEKTGKTGRTWVLASPRTINYLSMIKTSCLPDNFNTRDGNRQRTAQDYNYVFSCGDTDYYQDINITDESIYVGLQGGPESSSIYYTPYKEYFVQGGENYYTGQSNIFFRLRDAWVTNPLDNGTGTTDSEYIMRSTVSYTSMGTIIN